MTIDLQALAGILRTAQHHWLGITTDPPDPKPSPPVAIIRDRDMASFQYALSTAEQWWTHATNFALVGSDAERILDKSDPPNFKRLATPEILLQFTAGDQADPSDPLALDAQAAKKLNDQLSQDDRDNAIAERESNV